MKRRQVLFGASALGVIVGAAPRILWAGELGSERRPRISRERFEQLVNARFELLDSRDRCVETLVLDAVEDGPDCPGTDQFGLVFRGEGKGQGQPATHILEHAEEGRFALYLEPSASGKTAGYRASFSLLS